MIEGETSEGEMAEARVAILVFVFFCCKYNVVLLFNLFIFSQLRGMYIARQLSFSGVTFNIKEVKLCTSFIEMYDASVKLVSCC